MLQAGEVGGQKLEFEEKGGKSLLLLISEVAIKLIIYETKNGNLRVCVCPNIGKQGN